MIQIVLITNQMQIQLRVVVLIYLLLSLLTLYIDLVKTLSIYEFPFIILFRLLLIGISSSPSIMRYILLISCLPLKDILYILLF